MWMWTRFSALLPQPHRCFNHSVSDLIFFLSVLLLIPRQDAAHLFDLLLLLPCLLSCVCVCVRALSLSRPLSLSLALCTSYSGVVLGAREPAAPRRDGVCHHCRLCCGCALCGRRFGARHCAAANAGARRGTRHCIVCLIHRHIHSLCPRAGEQEHAVYARCRVCGPGHGNNHHHTHARMHWCHVLLHQRHRAVGLWTHRAG